MTTKRFNRQCIHRLRIEMCSLSTDEIKLPVSTTYVLANFKIYDVHKTYMRSNVGSNQAIRFSDYFNRKSNSPIIILQRHHWRVPTQLSKHEKYFDNENVF